jgi:Na+-driven multidrug efflux pump
MAVSAVSNVVYTIYVGRLGIDAISAVSLVFPVSLLALTAMGGGIGAGATSAIARALGAGERREAGVLAGEALCLSVGMGVAFGLAALVGAPALFRLMGASGAVHEGATAFARVLFGGVAITFFSMMLDAVMRGEGNVRTPAVWSVVSLLLQMAVTPLFMFALGWGLVGGAIAMLACHLACVPPRVRWVFGGRGVVRPALRPAATRLAPTREILRVGVPAAVSTSTNNLGLMALTAVVTRLGTADLAAYGLGTRLDFVLMSFGYGVGAGGLGRATVPLVVTVARVGGVLLAALVCTRTLALGEGAVFGSIAVGNALAAVALVALFVATEHRLQSVRAWTKPATAP